MERHTDIQTEVQTDNQTELQTETEKGCTLDLEALRPLGWEEHGASDMCATLSVQ